MYNKRSKNPNMPDSYTKPNSPKKRTGNAEETPKTPFQARESHIAPGIHIARLQSLTLAPIPLPIYQTVSVHDPSLTPTVAFASSFNVPPIACFIFS